MRVERDFLGELPIAAEADWGIHTARVLETGAPSRLRKRAAAGPPSRQELPLLGRSAMVQLGSPAQV